jgi:hypothetical protein
MTQTRWITWAVPAEYLHSYLLVMFMSLYILPKYIFGLSFTTLGWLINLLWFDFVFYIWYKIKVTIESKLKGRNDDESNRME